MQWNAIGKIMARGEQSTTINGMRGAENFKVISLEIYCTIQQTKSNKK
jgi:hypothetical protein